MIATGDIKNIQKQIPEIATMAANLGNRHGHGVMMLAGLVQLTRSLLSKAGKDRSVNIEPMLDIQWECVRAWTDANGVSLSAVTDALLGLRQAGQTAEYLSAIPE